MTPHQRKVVALLAEYEDAHGGAAPVRWLGEKLGVPEPLAMKSTLDALRRRGLAYRPQPPRFGVVLTKAGRAALAEEP